MKCLSEYQHELLLTRQAGMKKVFWGRHLRQCENCRVKNEEIKENMSFLKGIENTMGRNR